MTLEQIIKERIKRYQDIPDRLMNGVEKSQLQMLSEIDSILAQLEVSGGNLVMSKGNIIMIGKVIEDLQKVLHGSDYVDAVKTFIAAFPPQAQLTEEMFKKMGLDLALSDSKQLEAVLLSGRTSALQLLSDNAIDNYLLTPIRQQLNASVTAQASFKDTMDTIRIFINGDKSKETPIEGNMYRYVKQVAYDSYATADRTYAQTINESLGLEWYRYVGGELPTTRCFCEERNGKYFHKKEIQLFGEGKLVGSCGNPWQGMRKGTNSETIFTFAGGYNCHHTWVPVMEEKVPPQYITLAKQKGYIQ